MPGLDGLEVTRILAGPGVAQPLRVVVVTTFDDDAYVDSALDNGALGFLLKDAGPALLIEAVRAAAHGDALISPALTLRLLQRRQPTPNPPHPGPLSAPALTERELQVVRLVARGLTNTEICDELFLSLGTVKSHLSSVQSKLQLTNRVQIAAWAWENRQVT
jgi:DNA-binding NarL/FixJ family response regulator